MIDLDKLVDEQLNGMLSAPGAVKPVIVFPEANDPRIISAASGLINQARVVLIGEAAEIRSLCDYKSAELYCPRDRFFSQVQIVNPARSELKEELAMALQEASKGRKWEFTSMEAREKILNPVFFGAMLVRLGYADACLGGVANSTKDFLAPCLRLIKSSGTAFEMGLFCLPDEDNPLWENNVVMFADVALNLKPSPEQLSDIAVGACKTLRDIFPPTVLSGVNGAMISYSTKGSGQGPSVEAIRQAEPLAAQKLAALKESDPVYKDINITGELQISVAVSREAAQVKLKNRLDEFESAGKANVLIVPSLDEGNMLYHLFNTQYPEAQSSLIMGGMDGQVLDYSRGSSVLQVVRGAKLLLLTRIKAAKPLVRTSPLFPSPRIVAINPGSVSTQIAVFDGDAPVLNVVIEHDKSGANASASIVEETKARLTAVRRTLEKHDIDPCGAAMIMSRGGMLPGPQAGTYRISEAMLTAIENGAVEDHPSNLGAFMAWELSEQGKTPAFIVDCPTIDELTPENRLTGIKGIEKTPIWHALSQRQAARMYADLANERVQDLNLIVAHLGSGVSIGSHARGKCINVENAIFDGPMGPSRAGDVPAEAVIELCYAGLEKAMVKKIFSAVGGLYSHLGAHDLRLIQDRADDPDVAAVLSAMASGIASRILARLSDFYPEPVDQIILTGRMCLSPVLLEKVLEKLTLAGVEVTVFPGSVEAEALRDAAMRVYKDIDVPMRWEQ